MISKDERHAFEVEYKNVGRIVSEATGKWTVKLFGGLEQAHFDSEKVAIKFAKNKISEFQKNRQIPCSVIFEKLNNKPTHLLFTNIKTEEPYEITDYYWNQIQCSVDTKNMSKRLDQFSPLKLSFNDVARASAYTSKMKIRIMFLALFFNLMIMIAFLVTISLLMYMPTKTTSVLSKATNMPYQDVWSIVFASLGSILAIGSIVRFFIPFFQFFNIAKDESGGFSYEGKSWKKAYLQRIRGNWIAFGLSLFSVVCFAITNALLSETVFFNNSIHTFRTWMMVSMLIAGNLSVVGIFGVICGQIASTNNKRIIYLDTHIPPEDLELFKAWTTHKRIESKEYEYDYANRFTYPPSKERLRVISEEIYPKKLRISQKVKLEKIKDLELRYKIGMQKYTQQKKINNKKAGI